MDLRKIATALFILLFFTRTYSQTSSPAVRDYKFSVSTTYLSLINFDSEKTNTHHYELHFKYALTPKDKVGLKFATWRLFQPMGILWWEGALDKLNSETERYPGRLEETGLGVSYQRMLWKGLFATVEPQIHCQYWPVDTNTPQGFKEKDDKWHNFFLFEPNVYIGVNF